MEFDKSRVYTALNADEVKVGSKGIFANTVYELQKFVAEEKTITGAHIKKLVSIMPDDFQARFNGSSMSLPIVYSLFYLVEESEEEKYRPYKDTEEMIKDFLERYNSYNGNSNMGNPMYNPLIWIKRTGSQYAELIVAIGDKKVCANAVYTLDMLFDDFTYLDGSPCGIKGE